MVLLHKTNFEQQEQVQEIADKCNAKTTFGGHPCDMRKMPGHDDVLVRCKGLIGTFKQVDNFTKDGFGHFGGIKNTPKATMSFAPDGGIQIDCLIGTKKEIADMRKVCQEIISKSKEKEFSF